MLHPSILIIPPCCYPKHLNLIFQEAESVLKSSNSFEADLLLEPEVFLHTILPELVYEVPHTTINLRIRSVPEDLNSTLIHLSSRRHLPIDEPATDLIDKVNIRRIRKKDTPESLVLSTDITPRRRTPITITLTGELSNPLTPKMRQVHLSISKI